jgi:hypothetical protein|tara:strand:- start:2041 stop:2877 length:837 start_codon:yes stop_codon:yes gene_type:complete
VKIVFIADFFVEQVLGGGELNNDELLQILVANGHGIIKMNSHNLTESFIKNNKTAHFIIANFVNVKPYLLEHFYDKKYIIYEHDHKYMLSRNPGTYPDFKAPPEALVNVEFYKNAQAVLCQSRFHLEIIKKNLQLENLLNLSGNIWSTSSLDLMLRMSVKEKKDMCSIMHSHILHKNMREAVMYCEHTKKLYKLISSKNYESFLDQLSDNQTFVFFPQTPETLSRVVVEARMMGMSVIVNKMIGATREPWYELKGKDLIEYMHAKRTAIADLVVKAVA